MTSTKAELDILDRPDGSASYSHNGYSVLAAVNGPLEVQRRDELPDEAAIEVVVRPVSGVGAIRERYFESIIHNVLRKAIYTRAHPRTLIQVTIQVTSTPAETTSVSGKLNQAVLNLAILPSLLNAALLALLTASVPMQMTFAAAGLVVDRQDRLHIEPSAQQIHEAASAHVFCFGTTGIMLLYLVEGPVSPNNLATIKNEGQAACLGPAKSRDTGNDMDLDGASMGQAGLIKHAVLERLEKHESWRKLK